MQHARSFLPRDRNHKAVSPVSVYRLRGVSTIRHYSESTVELFNENIRGSLIFN